MRYRFTIDEAGETPAKSEVAFRARTPERAYRFVIDHIINVPENLPLKRGTLWRQGAFGWEEIMRWKRGPGWSHPEGHSDPGMVDNRVAPGA